MAIQIGALAEQARGKRAPWLCGCGRHKEKVDGVHPLKCEVCDPPKQAAGLTVINGGK